MFSYSFSSSFVGCLYTYAYTYMYFKSHTYVATHPFKSPPTEDQCSKELRNILYVNTLSFVSSIVFILSPVFLYTVDTHLSFLCKHFAAPSSVDNPYVLLGLSFSHSFCSLFSIFGRNHTLTQLVI